MALFYYFNDKDINLEKPELLVKDDLTNYFERQELRSFLRSELCALDMLYAVTKMNDGYYKERLVLKGGHSVRNLVSLIDHRFSFDADFNLNSTKDYTYGDVSNIKKDLYNYGQMRGCTTRTKVTQDSNMLYFLEIGYHDVLKKELNLIERPKIEICKQCRTYEKPILSKVNTMIDLDLLGEEPPELYHLDLEEQLANKLYVIGARGRQRNHFDAYDAYRICKNNSINWRKEKNIFEQIVEKSGTTLSVYSQECRKQLDAIKKNDGKRKSCQNTIFNSSSFDFDDMIDQVKKFYDFKL